MAGSRLNSYRILHDNHPTCWSGPLTLLAADTCYTDPNMFSEAKPPAAPRDPCVHRVEFVANDDLVHYGLGIVVPHHSYCRAHGRKFGLKQFRSRCLGRTGRFAHPTFKQSHKPKTLVVAVRSLRPKCLRIRAD